MCNERLRDIPLQRHYTLPSMAGSGKQRNGVAA